MNCVTDGVLRTFLDGELKGSAFAAVEVHVRNCERCAARLQSIQRQTSSVQEHLAALEQDLPAGEARLAYACFEQTYGGRAVANRFSGVWRSPALGWLAAAVVALLLLGFSPGRTWAQKVLEMLRVQKLAVLPMDLSSLTLQDGFGHGGLLAQFMSDNVVVIVKPGPSVVAADAASASQMVGYPVRTLDALGVPQTIFVNGEGAFQMILNRDRLRELLEQVGRSDISIPRSVDGGRLVVHVPRMVLTQYGSCGHSTNTETCINFTQLPSPSVSVPPSLNIEALAEAVLQVTGMSAANAHAFAKTVDWSSTLVIPIPETEATYSTVRVDGVKGALIESVPNSNFGAHYQLIWLKNGVLYSMEGQGSVNRALAAAGSLS
jgi:hypothetical protein